jgi:ATP-binding cassette subfamily C (CFTR/MRP) protein 1
LDAVQLAKLALSADHTPTNQHHVKPSTKQVRNVGGLDGKLDGTGGQSWSIGQQQLMCLARAALKKVGAGWICSVHPWFSCLQVASACLLLPALQTPFFPNSNQPNPTPPHPHTPKTQVPVLCLDEATAAMDPHTEAHVLEIIERIFSERTTLTIAHRWVFLRVRSAGMRGGGLCLLPPLGGATW